MGEFAIEYESRLVEEAVFCAVRTREEETDFRAERDQLYEIPDPETRETEFRVFHAACFERLGLGEGIAAALQEQPAVAANVGRCLVASALSSRDEGAELFVLPENGQAEAQRRAVLIRLTPETLTLPDRLGSLLRHELFHIADMLDPCFGYQPRLPVTEAGPTPDRLLRDRYRVLWDAFIDGRLARLGRAPSGIRAERLDDFARAFPMLRERAGEAFERFFNAESLTHAALVTFAADPEGALGRKRGGPHPGGRCPLCGFPTHDFEPEPDRLPLEVWERIRELVPGWDPANGLCRQCADLYRSRSLQEGWDSPRDSGQEGGNP